MSQNRKVPLSIIVVFTMILALFLIYFPSYGSETTPEIFQLNPSPAFGKEAIREWVKGNSWEKAYNLVKASHHRKVEDGYSTAYSVTFYTPIVSWVEAHYIGEQRFWSNLEIMNRYSSTYSWPLKRSKFLVSIRTTEKAAVKKENLKFVLKNQGEENEKRWTPEKVSPREIKEHQYLGTTVYDRVLDVYFNFNGANHPSFNDRWMLYLIREDKVIRSKVSWRFEKGYCDSVEEITVASNITDISPFTKCDELKQLELTSGTGIDLSPLTKLSNLKQLELDPRCVDNIKPLYKLKNLKKLTVLVRKNYNLSWLANLQNSPKLELYGEIHDLSFLQRLEDLRHLSVSFHDKVPSLLPLTKLQNLEYLEIRFAAGLEEKELKTISELESLVYLDLGGNDIINIAPLKKLVNLQELHLVWNSIQDISVLANLKNLTLLNLSANKISDIKPLVKNPGLGEGDEIFLQGNKLDLSEGSEDLRDIQTLLDRGIEVDYYPQKEEESS